MFTSSGGSVTSKSSTVNSVWASILVSNLLAEEAEHWGCVHHLLVLRKKQGHSVSVLVAQDNKGSPCSSSTLGRAGSQWQLKLRSLGR